MQPLTGVTVVDLSALAPGPYCSMLLADLGAEVISVGGAAGAPLSQVSRGKRMITLNLRSEAGRAALHRIVARADVVIEGFRPGVAARLGASYDELRQVRPDLVYCSLTGYGQDGPLAQTAGHDINYLAIAGFLGAVGPVDGPPIAPLNLLADFAGGSWQAVVAILGALLHRHRTGEGQHLDVAMVDGVQSMMAMHSASWGSWALPSRGSGILAGDAPFYRCYECADGRFVAVGAMERKFFETLWTGLGLTDPPEHMDPDRWPELTERIEAAFLTRSRDEWAAHFADQDACVSPVLDPDEAYAHPYAVHRHGTLTPGEPPPAPLSSRPFASARPLMSDDVTDEVLLEAGLAQDEIDAARGSRAAGTLSGWPPPKAAAG